jgi:hypothetical protein
MLFRSLENSLKLFPSTGISSHAVSRRGIFGAGLETGKGFRRRFYRRWRAQPGRGNCLLYDLFDRARLIIVISIAGLVFGHGRFPKPSITKESGRWTESQNFGSHA